MMTEVKKCKNAREYETDERCHIIEIANDAGDEFLSIAQARVEPGITTAWHQLIDTSERYIIVSGRGLVEIGELAPLEVNPGDVVRIAAGEAQRITNSGAADLVFFAVCTPPFRQRCYRSLE